MNEWQQSPIYSREDGSYIITFNSNPYHVPQEGGWLDGTEEVQWPDIHAWALAHPDQLQAEALPPEPSAEELSQARVAEIKSALQNLDSAKVRPMSAMLDGSATEADQARLVELNKQTEALRVELRSLEAPQQVAAAAKTVRRRRKISA